MEGRVVKWLILSTYSKKACLCRVYMFSLCLRGFSSGTPASSYVNWGLIGHSKLPIGVNVSLDGCLSFYVSPVMKMGGWMDGEILSEFLILLFFLYFL